MTSRTVSGLAVGLAVTLALAAFARAPMPLRRADDALLRLSWGARPERVEACRTLSDEELAQRPAHMRQRLECTGGAASYRLRARLDGRTLVDAAESGGGLRRDRRIFVFREFPVAPGSHLLEVEFVRVDSTSGGAGEGLAPDSGATVRDRREADARRRLQLDAVPPRLVLAERIEVSARQVVLVSYDADRRALVTSSARP